MKAKGEKIACLTAYDYPTARAIDNGGIDLILIGDTAAMVVAGHKSTLPITMDQMLFLTASVARAEPRALVVADMPFGSYEEGPELAIANASRFLKEAGAEAVKIEGGVRAAELARALVNASIPVMGHVGMTPQSTHLYGGYRVQGKRTDDAKAIMDDAGALEDAGCFSIVLEAVPHELAKEITATLEIPTIGIGAGPDCDGQILVLHDIIGLFEWFKPTFVRRYAEVGDAIRSASSRFSEDVKSGDYPTLDESY